MTRAAGAAALVLATAACIRPGDPPPGPAPLPDGAGPQLTDAQMPHPRAGEWYRKGEHLFVGERICLDGGPLGGETTGLTCPAASRQHAADGRLVVSGTCPNTSGATGTYRVFAVVSGEYQTKFSVDAIYATSPTPGGPSLPPSRAVTTWEYLGPCPGPAAPAPKS